MAEVKTMPPSRALVLNTLIAVLIAVVVFSVGTWVLLVPQMARQEGEIRELRAAVVTLQGALDESNAAREKIAAPAAAPAAAGASAQANPAPAAPAAK